MSKIKSLAPLITVKNGTTNKRVKAFESIDVEHRCKHLSLKKSKN